MFGLSKREIGWTVDIAYLKDMVTKLTTKVQELTNKPDPITYCKECGVAFKPLESEVLFRLHNYGAPDTIFWKRELAQSVCSRCLPTAQEKQRIIDYATANPEKVKPCVDAATAPKRKRKA